MKKFFYIHKVFLITTIPLWIILAAVVSNTVWAQKDAFPINSDASCITTSCHADLAKKEYIHIVASDGEMCTVCHELEKEGIHLFKLKAEGGSLCAECHGEKAVKEHKHYPVQEGMCTSCHDPHQSDIEYQLIEDLPGLCYQCHENKVVKEYKHYPVQEGLCTSCHDPHDSDIEYQLIEDLPGLCYECHENKTVKEHKHYPVEEGLCTSCHNPHQSDIEHQLIEDLPGLCYQCHENKADKKYQHSPVKEGMCTTCHFPHDSDASKLLVMPAVDTLCFICHDADEFKGLTPHSPVSEGRCLDCHSPHSTDNPRQLVKPVPDLCFDCHSTELKDTKGVVIPSTKDLFEDKEMKLHRPFAEGKCINCHFPHPADNYRRLKGSYTGNFYASFSEEAYRFCSKCHSNIKNALIEPRTLVDTKFRNGNLNLHYRHVNRKKGRTCRTCHHHHGSKNPKLIRQTFPFGKRTLTIKYEKTDTGGSCAPVCHTPVTYDRYEPVKIQMKTTPRAGKDASPEELRLSRERDMGKLEKKTKSSENKEKRKD